MAEVLEREGWRVRLRGRVPAEEVEAKYRDLIRHYQKRAKIPGFRPGRVPERVLVAKIGREALLSEVKEELLREHLNRAFEELGLNPVAVREVEGEPEVGEDFVFVAEIENYPEVKLPDWRSFEIPAETPEVSEEELEQTLTELRRRYAEAEPKEGAVAEGDVVFLIDPEGKEIVLELERAYDAVKEALLGRRAGEEVELPLFNEKGEPTGETARMRVKEVRELKVPELDDEFAKVLGYASLAEAREKVREELLKGKEQALAEERRRAFLRRLAAEMEAEVPPSLIESEERVIWGEIAEDLAKRGVPLEDYLKSLSEEEFEKLRREVREGAESRVRQRLALDQLVKDLGVRFADEEWEAYLEAMAQAYGMKKSELLRALGEEGLRRVLAEALRNKALREALAAISA